MSNTPFTIHSEASERALTSPRILILRGGALGDFILTLPVIRALRQQWPAATIELIGNKSIAELAVVAGLIDRVRPLSAAGMAEWFVPCRVWPEQERNELASFDLIISYLSDSDGVVQANLRAAGVKRVLACNPVVTDGHAADHFLQPVMELGGGTMPFYRTAATTHGVVAVRPPATLCAALRAGQNRIGDPLLPWPEALRQQGRDWLKQQGFFGEVVCLHPGSGSSRKNWPLEQFVSLAARLRQRNRAVEALFILGEADTAEEQALMTLAPGMPRLINRPLPEVASVLAASQGYVGNDSGITHLAAALGIPVVALFGPTEATVWSPRGANVRVLQAEEPTKESLAAIKPEVVLRALAGLMANRNSDRLTVSAAAQAVRPYLLFASVVGRDPAPRRPLAATNGAAGTPRPTPGFRKVGLSLRLSRKRSPQKCIMS